MEFYNFTVNGAAHIVLKSYLKSIVFYEIFTGD